MNAPEDLYSTPDNIHSHKQRQIAKEASLEDKIERLNEKRRNNKNDENKLRQAGEKVSTTVLNDASETPTDVANPDSPVKKVESEKPDMSNQSNDVEQMLEDGEHNSLSGSEESVSQDKNKSEKDENKTDGSESSLDDVIKGTNDLSVKSDHSTEEPKPAAKNIKPVVLEERFKNARQDVPIEFEVKRVKDGDDKLNWQNCRIDESCKCTDEEMGLSFDEEQSLLKLTPSKPGDFIIIFTREPGYRLECKLTVIADPRKLWDSKEPPKDSPYPKVNKQSAMMKIGDRILAGASIRGRSHARDGTHRDDDFSICELVDGWMLMLVADGAGSAKFSREGSKILVDTMREGIKTKLEDDSILAQTNGEALAIIDGSTEIDLKNNHLLGAAFAGYKDIKTEAENNNARPKDYNTTVISCLFKEFGEQTLLYSFCIGDGAIFAIEVESGDVKPLNAADSGEFAGQTVFLTTPQVWEDPKSLYGRIKTAVITKPLGILAMTDGVSDPLLPDIEQIDDAKHTTLLLQGDEDDESLEGLIAVLRRMVDNNDAKVLEDWLEFYVARHHDDRTITLAFDPQFLS